MIAFLLSVANPAPPPIPPVCREPSHDRLIVQPGRDVCGAALNAQGEPRAAGFLPTACADSAATYRIDARRRIDLCVTAKAGA